MDGHGDDGLQDLFPEGDPAFPAPAFDLLSQAESSGVPREGLQALDLNSQAEDWGDYSSYSDLLRGEGAPRGRGSRSLGLRAARSGGRGGGSGSRAGAGGSRGGGGGSRAGGGGSRAGAGGSRAGGGGASVTRPLFEPSLADGAGGSGGRSGGRGGGRARRSRGRGGRSTADYIEPYDVENWVDVDDEDGAPQNVETIFPTSKEYEFDIDESSSSDDDLSTEIMGFMWMQQYHRKRTRDIAMAAVMIGTYYDTYMDKAPHRVPTVSGIEWVHETLCSRTACYNMFRMSSVLFYQLHDLLVENYGLRATRGMTTMEALGMFLWVIGAPQSLRQVEDRFVRSLETISRTFDNVLSSVLKLAVDIIKPKDPEFRTVHPRLRNPRFAPYFNNCIGAIDGTHIPVVVPNDKVVQHTGRHGYTSQNVLAICDFDMRFTFAVTGWPGSVHDMRVFSDALNKYGDKFPHPPAGKFYLVDSGYANRPGYLAPYKGTKYHLPEFRSGPMPKGMKETFNYAHSSLRNVIERSFGVLKMKWRILLGIPSFPMQKQSKIIVACMAIHNFIRENDMADRAFDMCDRDENFIPMPQVPNDEGDGINTQAGEEDCNMNAFRDELANALYNKS